MLTDRIRQHVEAEPGASADDASSRPRTRARPSRTSPPDRLSTACRVTPAPASTTGGKEPPSPLVMRESPSSFFKPRHCGVTGAHKKITFILTRPLHPLQEHAPGTRRHRARHLLDGGGGAEGGLVHPPPSQSPSSAPRAGLCPPRPAAATATESRPSHGRTPSECELGKRCTDTVDSDKESPGMLGGKRKSVKNRHLAAVWQTPSTVW